MAGESDAHQLEIIFELVGPPTDMSMPGWKQLPGAEGLTPKSRPATLSSRFRDHGAVAVSLLKELMQLDWRRRINAHDALEHPYFKTAPLPARPDDIPHFEDSHELDRRKFHDRKAALPPAPKGGSVGVGAFEAANGDFGGNGGYGNKANGGRYPPHGDRRNGGERKPAWVREQPRHEHRLPPRPPPPENPSNGWDGPSEYHDRDRAPRSRGPPPNRDRVDVDTYIPAYTGGSRDSRPPLDRPPRDRDRGDYRRRRDDDRDDRRHDYDSRRERDYDERSRASMTRSRSRSPAVAPRDRDRDRDRDMYRR